MIWLSYQILYLVIILFFNIVLVVCDWSHRHTADLVGAPGPVNEFRLGSGGTEGGEVVVVPQNNKRFCKFLLACFVPGVEGGKREVGEGERGKVVLSCLSGALLFIVFVPTRCDAGFLVGPRVS